MTLANQLKQMRLKRGLAGASTKVVKASLFRVFEEAESPSPTDKGFFKGGWFFASGSPDLTVNTNKSRDSKGALRVQLASFKVGEVAFFTNNMPYAERLEGGWSDQAKQGMVRLAARNWQSIVDEEVRKASR
jgi:ribosomal protein L10